MNILKPMRHSMRSVLRVGQLTPGLVRDVREEGGDLAPAVGRGAAAREVGVGARGAQERGPRVEGRALAPGPRVGLDAAEERGGDDARHGRAGAGAGAASAAAPRARARLAPLAAVGAGRAAVAVLATAQARLAAAALRGRWDDAGGAEERQPDGQHRQDRRGRW